jgi:N-acetylated-alpha-linked acidic dipeptidase
MQELPLSNKSKIRTLSFHGASASGNVAAQFVYANFGHEQDYDDLEHSGIVVKGKMAMVRYGMVWRGAKLNSAVKRGFVGIVVYSDPLMDGNVTEQHGYNACPDGLARPDTCVERGAMGSIGKSYRWA